MQAEPIGVTMTVINALEDLGVRYVVVGSLASAVHGVVRATIDADLVADLDLDDVEPLAKRLNAAFYADQKMMRDAVRCRASFNLIHLETTFKVDVFVAKSRSFDQAHLLSDALKARAYVATAEDIVLSKLEWYQMGGCVSDRQWRDVLGVLKVQGDRLDLDYLRGMAVSLDVTGLLTQALAEARE